MASVDEAEDDEQEVPGLLSLPAAALWQIARGAGLPSRRVCRALRDAYGPPDGTVHITADPTTTLLRALTTDCARLAHVSTLCLHSPFSPPACPRIPALLAAIPATTPRLRALSLTLPAVSGPPPDPTTLAPLALTLTSLALHTSDPHLPLLAPLTGLRALSLTTTSCATRPLITALLHALAPLSLLQDLAFSTPQWDCDFTDNFWLPLLPPAAPHLTALSLGVLLGWDALADATLRGSFSGLRRLSIAVADALPAPQAPAPPLCMSLPFRDPPLQELHLHLLLTPDSTPRLPPGIQLRSLQVTTATASAWERLLLPVLHHQTQLTRLAVSFMPAESPTQLLDVPATAALQGTLEELHVTCHAAVPTALRHAPHLPALRSLGLHCRSFPPCCPNPAAAQLSQVASLTRLAVSGLVVPGSLLQHISHLPRLQHLALQEVGWHSTRSKSDVVDLHHLAGPLQHSLTSLTLDGTDGLVPASLAAVRGLTVLQELQVARLRHVPVGMVEAALVPLPRSLRVLNVAELNLPTGLEERLKAAAKQQDCRWCYG